ncbi:MAG: hypothetical protein WC551_08160 [Patescibacteria group bacterium]
MHYIPLFLLITVAAMVGLWWSNYFYDHGIKHWLSRKVGHWFGGLAFLLMPFLFADHWILAVVLVGCFAVMLTAARLFQPHTFRGVGGSARPGALSELYFPWVAVPILILGWGVWGRPLESVACLLFMAWGDAVTGWTRALMYNTPTKGTIGSVCMFGLCFIIAWAFIEPLWIGAAAALAATVTEWACGDVGKIKLDDNLMIPLVSFAVAMTLLHVWG